MRFYLNQHGLRMVDDQGNGWSLENDGSWRQYEGYDTWPETAAKIEYRFTGAVPS